MITENTASSEEITINAPIELVWDVLVDFPAYSQWNSFCPSAQTSLEIGSPIVMKTLLGDQLIDQTEYIRRIEPPYAIAWGMENKPGDSIHAVRSQFLKKLDNCRCTYCTIDEFSGDGVAMMMEHFGKAMEDGFNACGQGLKQRCEALYAEQQG